MVAEHSKALSQIPAERMPEVPGLNPTRGNKYGPYLYDCLCIPYKIYKKILLLNTPSLGIYSHNKVHES